MPTSFDFDFRDCPQVFASNKKRILFILSYLKGSALSWFEPGLNDPMNSAHWIWNYQAFLSELEDNFSPHNPVGDAEKALNELTMKKGAHIIKYNVNFWNSLSMSAGMKLHSVIGISMDFCFIFVLKCLEVENLPL